MFKEGKCEYCGEQFAKNDDIVVCPDCGAPYHRACWQAHGSCAHKAEHAQGYVFGQDAPETAPAETAGEDDFIEKIKTEMFQEKADRTEAGFCENCGAELLDGDAYCVYCGHKKGDPIRSAKRKHAGKNPLGGLSPDETVGGEKVSDLALLVRTNSDKLLPKLKRVDAKKVKIGWSWPAFFFGYLYLFFRKLYKYGVIVIMAEVLLFNVLNFAMGDPLNKTMQAVSNLYNTYGEEITSAAPSEEVVEEMTQQLWSNGLVPKLYALFGASLLVSNAACALLFYYLYLRHCKDTIARMNRSAEILGDMSKADYRLNLLARGGISIFGIALGYVSRLMIEQIVSYILQIFGS